VASGEQIGWESVARSGEIEAIPRLGDEASQRAARRQRTQRVKPWTVAAFNRAKRRNRTAHLREMRRNMAPHTRVLPRKIQPSTRNETEALLALLCGLQAVAAAGSVSESRSNCERSRRSVISVH
jgi:hypothetical protein